MLSHCQYCHAVLPPWRMFDCEGANSKGRGNCEMRNGSAGRVHNPHMSSSDSDRLVAYYGEQKDESNLENSK